MRFHRIVMPIHNTIVQELLARNQLQNHRFFLRHFVHIPVSVAFCLHSNFVGVFLGHDQSNRFAPESMRAHAWCVTRGNIESSPITAAWVLVKAAWPRAQPQFIILAGWVTQVCQKTRKQLKGLYLLSLHRWLNCSLLEPAGRRPCFTRHQFISTSQVLVATTISWDKHLHTRFWQLLAVLSSFKPWNLYQPSSKRSPVPRREGALNRQTRWIRILSHCSTVCRICVLNALFYFFVLHSNL